MHGTIYIYTDVDKTDRGHNSVIYYSKARTKHCQ